MENQRLNTIDLGLMFALIGFTLAVVASQLKVEKRRNPQMTRAFVSAQNLALQLSTGGFGVLNDEEKPHRELANIKNSTNYKKSLELFGKQGKMGQDPWGSAFRFNFLESEVEGIKSIYVIVWSDGPNGQKETHTDVLENLNKAPMASGELQLNGDDLGYIKFIE